LVLRMDAVHVAGCPAHMQQECLVYGLRVGATVFQLNKLRKMCRKSALNTKD
jgi:hypothetical protein